MMDTNFDQLLEFPCQQTFKIMGIAHERLPQDVISCLQVHAPGDYVPKVKPSSKGTYHSISLSITVTSKAHMETLYIELAKLELVKVVL
jgi:putative lipoic acid-binding regulatory protein|tara:strand:- start:15 stop:281 length:267 start_codon:yes stop_codon:yes gene_type:complete